MNTSTSIARSGRRLILVALLLFSLNVVRAQFNLSATAVSGTVEQNGYLNLEIDMDNTLADSLTLEWETMSNTLPAGWDATLCDYQQCFASVIAGRVMEPVPPGGHGFIKLTIGPNMVIGSGVVTFDVWERGNTASKQTITYTVNAVVGVDAYDLSQDVHMYPNPASDRVFLGSEKGTIDAGTVKITNLSGAVVKTLQVNPTTTAEVDVRDLAPGLYIFSFETLKGSMNQKLIITR